MTRCSDHRITRFKPWLVFLLLQGSSEPMNIPLTPIRFLRYAQQQFPGKTAVVCGDERFTYGQFAGRAARLAGALRRAGVKPGDRVAFLSTNCHRLLEAY